MLFLPEDEIDSWEGWGFDGPGHPCFLCAEPLGDGPAVMWCGSTGDRDQDLRDTLNGILASAMVGGPVTVAAFVFFHSDCVPGFCRRLLLDWESSQDRVQQGPS